MKGWCLAVLALQGWLIAIPAIDASRFDRAAIELKRDASWRYGYVHMRHGAEFVKARAGSSGSSSPEPATDAVSAFMARELRMRPWKAGLELAFYGGLLLLAHAARSRTASEASVAGGARRAARAAGLAAILVSAAMAPYLLWGYGEPLFSTWRGPGALSSSGLVPTTVQVEPAVSYGLLLEWVVIVPMLVTMRAAERLSTVAGLRESLWLVAAAFWGVLAAATTCAGSLRTPADRSRRPVA